MKRLLRILCVVLSVVAIALLTGCKELDALRARQAFWDNGNIRLGNYEYIPLTACAELQPTFEYDDDYITVTEKDVPLLLSVYMGTELTKSTDGIFISASYYRYSEDYDGSIYCRSDKYDEMQRRIAEGFKPEGYCYSYNDYDTEDGITVKHYKLTQDEIAALNAVLSEVEPEALPDNIDVNYDFCVSLEGCSGDLLFRSGFCDLYLEGESYCILLEKDGKALIYSVPQKYNQAFKSIMSAEIESENKYLAETYSY